MVPTEPDDSDIDPPPFFKTWKGLYTWVLWQLVVTIVGFYLFTKLFE